MFVISPDSVRSSFCEEEVEHAAGLNKRIVPLSLQRVVDDVEIPEEVRFRNWIPARTDGEFEARSSAWSRRSTPTSIGSASTRG